MKIDKITREGNVFTVTFKPYWFESILGIKEKQKKYKDIGETFVFGGGHVYVDQKGKRLGNLGGYKSKLRKRLDEWRLSF